MITLICRLRKTCKEKSYPGITYQAGWEDYTLLAPYNQQFYKDADGYSPQYQPRVFQGYLNEYRYKFNSLYFGEAMFDRLLLIGATST